MLIAIAFFFGSALVATWWVKKWIFEGLRQFPPLLMVDMKK